jgi:hypothetical protein
MFERVDRWLIYMRYVCEQVSLTEHPRILHTFYNVLTLSNKIEQGWEFSRVEYGHFSYYMLLCMYK